MLDKEVKTVTSPFFPLTDAAECRKRLRDRTAGTLKRLLVCFGGGGGVVFLKKILPFISC